MQEAIAMTAAEALDRRERPTASEAKRLLVGRGAPFAPEEGVAALESLAENGDADALSTLATLRGAGAWTHHSWPEALDLLQTAAELGSAEARGQLLVLTPDHGFASDVRSGAAREPDRWRALKESVDLGEWVTPLPPVQVCDAPRVWTAERFTTPQLCEWLLSRARDRFTPALMRDATTGVAEALDTRTCSDFAFDVVDGGIVMLLLRVKISNATRIPVPHMEPPQIFHYAIGEEIQPHYDYLFDGKTAYGPDGNYTGDRLATFLLYLNDGYEGGELEFPYGPFSYKGRPGDGIFFASQRDKKPDPKSLHGATPVTRGEKFILSQWIHNQPFAA
jgi:prolyl 4-hydroxylase